MLRQLNKLFLLFPLILWGQQEYVFTTANGLPSNTVYDVVQDANGFIWIATSKGVAKYNGKTFKTFTVQEGLPNNDTWKLEVTPDGKVWYASKSNRQGYIANDSVYSFPVEKNRTVSPKVLGIDGNKMSFFASGSYFINDSIWKYVAPKVYGSALKPSFQINDSIVLDKDGASFDVYKKKNQAYKKSLSIPVDFSLINNSVYPFPAGLYGETVWQIHPEFLFLMNFNSGEYETVSIESGESVLKQFVWANDKGIQWKIRDSLKIFDYKYNLIKSVGHEELDNYNRAILDNAGNLWMTSLSEGLKMIPSIALLNKDYFSGQKVQKLEVIDDTLFAGVYDRPLSFYNNKSFKETALTPRGNIYGIRKTKHYGIYVFASTSAVSERNPILRQNIYLDYENFLTVPADENLAVRDVVEFKDTPYSLTHAYISRKEKGVSKRFQVLKRLEGTTGFATINDTLLILTSGGMLMVDGDTILDYPNQQTDRPVPYLSSKNINKSLFLGTDGFGVQVLENGICTEIPETKGLSVNRIIQKDSLLWLATQRGVQVLKLNKVLQKSEIINSFYTADGILDRNVNDIAIQDSLLFVATDLGLSSLNLKSKEFSQKPVVYFETKSDTLQFPFENAKNISIAFGTLDYTNQENIQYSYRLLPEQKDWQRSASQSITFSSLSPENYTLQVTATDQHHNNATKSLTIQVLPAWWQTSYFKVVAMLIAFATIGALSWSFYSIIKRRAQQKAEREKKLAGLELQALRSQMNPHFVHNSLNAIQYFVQRNEVALSEKYLSRFSKLIRQFFEFSRKQTLPLSEEIDLLTNYLEIEKMRFEDKLNYTLEIDAAIDTENVVIPSMILQPIVENAINHGIFHKEGKGTIQLRIHKTDKRSLKIEIEDDGVGLQKSKEIYQQSDRNYRSNSTQVLKERLALLEQNKDWNITYRIDDLTKQQGEKGTLVTLKLTPPYDS